MEVGSTDYSEFLFDELAVAVEQVNAFERVVRGEFLAIVRALATHEDEISRDGCRDVSGWLCMRLAISRARANEIVSVALATTSLPHVLAAFESGSLSWDKLVLVCEFATAETDEQFARECTSMTMNQLKVLAGKTRMTTEELDALENRKLRFWISKGGKAMRFTGFCPVEQGVVIRDQVEHVGNGLGKDEHGNYLPAEKLNIDALFEICSDTAELANTKIVFSADVETLSGLTNGVIDFEGIVSPDQVRMALCSASVELAITQDGKTIGSSRATRLFPPKVVERLLARDLGCRFPGCNRRRWLHGHHVKEWENGGESNEDNGVILCDHHHRVIHLHKWRIEGDVYGPLRFVRSDGRVFDGRAPVPKANVRRIAKEWKRAG